MKPCSIGLKPLLDSLTKSVLRPIAPRAITMANLLMPASLLVTDDILSGDSKLTALVKAELSEVILFAMKSRPVLKATIPRKSNMNQGNILLTQLSHHRSGDEP